MELELEKILVVRSWTGQDIAVILPQKVLEIKYWIGASLLEPWKHYSLNPNYWVELCFYRDTGVSSG